MEQSTQSTTERRHGTKTKTDRRRDASSLAPTKSSRSHHQHDHDHKHTSPHSRHRHPYEHSTSESHSLERRPVVAVSHSRPRKTVKPTRQDALVTQGLNKKTVDRSGRLLANSGAAMTVFAMMQYLIQYALKHFPEKAAAFQEVGPRVNPHKMMGLIGDFRTFLLLPDLLGTYGRFKEQRSTRNQPGQDPVARKAAYAELAFGSAFAAARGSALLFAKDILRFSGSQARHLQNTQYVFRASGVFMFGMLIANSAKTIRELKAETLKLERLQRKHRRGRDAKLSPEELKEAKKQRRRKIRQLIMSVASIPVAVDYSLGDGTIHEKFTALCNLVALSTGMRSMYADMGS